MKYGTGEPHETHFIAYGEAACACEGVRFEPVNRQLVVGQPGLKWKVLAISEMEMELDLTQLNPGITNWHTMDRLDPVAYQIDERS